MYPEPLLGIFSCIGFDYGGEFLRVGLNVRFHISGTNQFQCRIEAQAIFFQLLVPDRKCGHYCRIGAQRDASHAARGAGGNAEVVDEDALRRRHIGVHQYSDYFAGFHGGEQSANEVVFLDDLVAVHGAVMADEAVEVNVVHGAGDHVHPVAVERMSEGGKLPAAEVRGQEKNALGAGVGALVVFESVIDDDLFDVVGRVFGKLADFSELAAERGEDPAKDAGAFGLGFFGKGHGEIAHTNAAQFAVEKVDDLGEADADGPRGGPRQDTENFDERPGCRVLESLPHRGKRDGSTVENYLQTQWWARQRKLANAKGGSTGDPSLRLKDGYAQDDAA
jgi:hypothetical protein